MRNNLKNARKAAELTQQQVADRIHIDLRYYKAIELGERLGSIAIWDALEDLLRINQRNLREDTPAPKENQLLPKGNQPYHPCCLILQQCTICALLR